MARGGSSTSTSTSTTTSSTFDAGGPADGGGGGGGNGGFKVDAILLQKYGAELLPVADRMGTALTHIHTKETALTSYGNPPWGDGEIGEAYQKFYVEQARPLLTSVEEMRQGIYKAADHMGVTSKNYVKTEEASKV